MTKHLITAQEISDSFAQYRIESQKLINKIIEENRELKEQIYGKVSMQSVMNEKKDISENLPDEIPLVV